MTDAGYAIILFNPMVRPFNFDEIPDSFTVEYFVKKFLEKWSEGEVRSHPEDTVISWTIPELDSGDVDNPGLRGLMSHKEKGIAFHPAPHSTIVTFVQWIRSVVPLENLVYLVETPDLIEILEITTTTPDEDIFAFLPYKSDSEE